MNDKDLNGLQLILCPPMVRPEHAAPLWHLHLNKASYSPAPRVIQAEPVRPDTSSVKSRQHYQAHLLGPSQHPIVRARTQLTFAVLKTAPHPVDTPQPSRHTFSSGADLSISATLCSCTTVYSLNVDVPMKWLIG